MSDVPRHRVSFLNVAQLVWWVISRDDSRLDAQFKARLSYVRQLYLEDLLTSGVKQGKYPAKITDFLQLLRLESHTTADIAAVARNLRRKEGWRSVYPNSPQSIQHRAKEFRDLVPDVPNELIVAALAQIAAEFFIDIEIYAALNRIQDALVVGLISATGRKNGIFGRTGIDQSLWPDYFFGDVDVLGGLVALPRNEYEAVGAIVSANSPVFEFRGGECFFWSDILFDAKEVFAVWPEEPSAEHVSGHRKRAIRPDVEERLRDLHARLHPAIRRKWPSLEARPSVREMSNELAVDPSIAPTKVGAETLRKILHGTHKPSIELGLTSPLGTHTHHPHRNTHPRKKR